MCSHIHARDLNFIELVYAGKTVEHLVIVSIHQPAYLPWLGYFDKIMQSEIFIFLDTVQFEKNSYINRNKIKTSQGTSWLTIPIYLKGHLSNSIADIQIDITKQWQKKHLKSIFHNYNKCKYFDDLYPKLSTLYQGRENNFAELIFEQTQFWMEELKITTKIVRSSQLQTCGRNSNLIVDLCEKFNATKYISGVFGKNYLNEDDFRQRSIEIVYQDFKHPRYPQLYGDFVPNLAIIDFWMNSRQTDLITNV